MINQIIDWILNLGTGILASIIASMIGIGASGFFIWRIRNKSKMRIQGTKIKGDVIQGNKKEGNYIEKRQKSIFEKRTSKINIEGSEINGDLIQGDKEKR